MATVHEKKSNDISSETKLPILIKFQVSNKYGTIKYLNGHDLKFKMAAVPIYGKKALFYIKRCPDASCNISAKFVQWFWKRSHL